MDVPGKRPGISRKLIWLAIICCCFLSFTFLETILTGHEQTLQRNAELIESIPAQYFLCRVWLILALVILGIGMAIVERKFCGRIPFGIYLGLGVFGFILVITRTLQYQYNVDDAYIYFRYIQNYILSGEMQFNRGEVILGFTSHLYLWILTPFAQVFGHEQLPLIARNLNIFVSLLNYLGLYGVLDRLRIRPLFSLAGAAMYALSYYHIVQSTYGMEAEVLLFLLISLIFTLLYNHRTLFAWVTVLIVLCRPEGIIVLGLASMYAVRIWGWRSLRYWIAPILGSLCYLIWLYLTFGTVIPHTITAKQLIYNLEADAAVRGIIIFISQLFTGYVVDPWLGLTILILVLLLIVIVMGRNIPIYFFLASVFCIMISFMLGNPLMFPWYFVWISILPMLIIPRVMEIVSSLTRPSILQRSSFVAVLILYAISVSYSSYPESPVVSPGGAIRHPLFVWDNARERLRLYKAAAQYLNTSGDGRPVVAVSEDGIFGYTYNGPVLTLDGLASKRVLEYYPLSPEQYYSPFAIAPTAVQALQPAHVVFLENFGRNSLLKDPEFGKNYRREMYWPLELWGGDGLYLYSHSAAD